MRARPHRTLLARGWEFELSPRASENHLKNFKLGDERVDEKDQTISKNLVIGNKTNGWKLV